MFTAVFKWRQKKEGRLYTHNPYYTGRLCVRTISRKSGRQRSWIATDNTTRSAFFSSALFQAKKTSKFTQSANQHMQTFNFFIKTYLKFLKTLLHVSVIRPSSGSL